MTDNIVFFSDKTDNPKAWSIDQMLEYSKQYAENVEATGAMTIFLTGNSGADRFSVGHCVAGLDAADQVLLLNMALTDILRFMVED